MKADQNQKQNNIIREPGTGEDGKAPILAAIRARVGFYDALTRNDTHLEPRAARRSLLDEELAAVDNSLADLRRRRNLLAPASACPPEVLTTIFRILSDLEPNHYPDPKDFLGVVSGELPPRLGWMKVVHVCYSWRRAAYTDGGLWTTVTTSLGMRWATEMLRLSRGLPVHLDVHNKETPKECQLSPSSLVTGHMHHISSLRVLGDDEMQFAVFDQIPPKNICVPAPSLESLTMYTRRGLGWTFDRSPLELFAGQTPRLQKLYLHNISPTPQLFGPQITALTLIFDVAKAHFCRAQRLLDALRNSPNLKSLCLKNHHLIIDDAEANSADDRLLAHCPHLSDLTLHCLEVSDSMFVFIHLATHRSAKVSLAGLYRTGHGVLPQQDTIIALFSEHMADIPLSRDMRTVEWRGYGVLHTPIRQEDDRVDAVYERTLTLSAWRASRSDYLLADYDDYEAPPPPDFKLTLGLRADFSNLIPEDILPWPQPFTSARNVSLQMTGRYPLTVVSWSNMLSGFPELLFLRIDRELAEDFLSDVNAGEAQVPNSVSTLALLGIIWAIGDGDDEKDRILANIWQQTRDRGGALSRVIVGRTPLLGGEWHDSIDEAEVVLESVQRPDWLDENHEDWDDRTDW